MEFKHLQLASIQPNPDNPRKTFDEGAVTELAESIKQHGVLQPILVRPAKVLLPGAGSGEQYQLICGERRYRAAKLAGIETIPATIREVSDEEALELMLMENFQRQDVHPMEEALGFESLVHRSKMPIKTISERVGKSMRYVADRMKLAMLIPELQKHFFEGKFNLATATVVAVLTPEDQTEWLNDQDVDDKEWRVNANKVHTTMVTAPFDTADEKLIPSRGACIGCSYNTASSALFPDEESNPRCLNKVCYINKCRASLTKVLERDVLIALTYSASTSTDVLKAVKDREWRRNYELSTWPKPTDEDLESELDDLLDFDHDEEELEAERKRVTTEHEESVRKYAEAWKKADSGKAEWVKGIVIESDFTYQWQLAKRPKPNESAKPGLKALLEKVESTTDSEGPEVNEDDLGATLEALQEERERLEALQDEKIFNEVTELFQDVKVTGDDGEEDTRMNPALYTADLLNIEDLRMSVYYMLDQIGGSDKPDFIEGHFGITLDFSDNHGFRYMDMEKAYPLVMETIGNSAKNIRTEFNDFVAAWFRYQIVDTYKFQASYRAANIGRDAQAYRRWAASIMPDKVEAIEDRHRSKYVKKFTEIDKQIYAIEKKLNEAKPSKKNKKK